MASRRFIEIDGKRYLYSYLVASRREQIRTLARVSQPGLFELREDRSPASQRTAAGPPSRADTLPHLGDA
jgi:hypothetical protein